jgi:predicted nucleic acid-binding protein
LPDAIIASTSLIYGLPLVTADKGYSKIEELDLILIEF